MMRNRFILNKSGLPKELCFLLEIIKANKKKELQFDENKISALNWELFLQFARHHRLYPLLYLRLKEIRAECVPDRVFHALRQLYQSNTFQMLYLSGETEQIIKQFAEHQIRTLFLKGPALAHDLYGDLSYRTSSDIDILIPMNDLEKADVLLTSSGYVKDDYIDSVLNDWKWRHHHFTYFHPKTKVKLEIHWRMNPGPLKEPGFDELWGRKRCSSLTETPVYLLSREDLFLFLVLHGSRHGWSRLRWLADIRQLVMQNPDWRSIRRLFFKYRCSHVGEQALILASQLLNAPIPEAIKPFSTGNRSQRLAQESLFYLRRIVNLHTEPVPEDVARYHKRHLFSLMSGRQKMIFVLSFLYPYPKDVETLPLPKWLHFLYFPLRPFLLVWRKTRKQELPRGM